VLGTRFRDGLPAHDAVGRGEGDRLVILLNFADREQQLSRLLDTVRDQTTTPVVLPSGEAISVSVRIGAALFPDDADNGAHLLRPADVALKRTKEHAAAGTALYTANMSERLVRRSRLEQAMQQALAETEFVPDFQPQVSLNDGTLLGFEALIRWRKADGAVVPPSDFIPLAQETGFVHEFGDAMIRQVVQQIAQWRARGLAVPVCGINVPPSHLRSAGFVERVCAQIDAGGVPAQSVLLELTETTFVEDFTRTKVIMQLLADYGVRFSLDDFGTGFSSLGYLGRLPLHVLKVDRSFVQQVDADQRQRAIVEAVIHMGQLLGLTVVAEGVETRSQAGRLTALGCDAVQGFLYGRPVPAADAVRWLTPVS